MSWIQFLITFVVLVLPAISWIFGKLRDQLEQKRIREEWVRRREEELRTGRPAAETPAAASASRNPDLEELAARRQEQIRRLREQQARAAGAAATTVARPPAPPQVRRPGTPAPNAPRPTPPRPRQPQPGVPYSTGATRPRPQPTRPARPAPQRPRPTPVIEPPPSDVPRRLVEPASDKPAEPKIHALELRQRELALERQRRLGIKATAQLPAATSSALGRISRDELRRAIILTELIRPPVSLRVDEQP